MGAIKTDVEKPLSSDQIKNNVNYLKRKLGKDTSPLYQRLYSDVNGISVHDLTWKQPRTKIAWTSKKSIYGM